MSWIKSRSVRTSSSSGGCSNLDTPAPETSYCCRGNTVCSATMRVPFAFSSSILGQNDLQGLIRTAGPECEGNSAEGLPSIKDSCTVLNIQAAFRSTAPNRYQSKMVALIAAVSLILCASQVSGRAIRRSPHLNLVSHQLDNVTQVVEACTTACTPYINAAEACVVTADPWGCFCNDQDGQFLTDCFNCIHQADPSPELLAAEQEDVNSFNGNCTGSVTPIVPIDSPPSDN